MTSLGRALVEACRGKHTHKEEGKFSTNKFENVSPTYRQPNFERLLSTSASQFTKDQIVVLYDKENDRVGEAVVSALEVGDLLEGNRIHPTKVGVSITAVYKSTTPINEIFKDTLGECLQCIIRWPRRLLRATRRYATNTVNAAEAVRVFEFSKDGIGAETPPEGSNRKSALGSVVGSNSSSITDYQCPVQDGLPHPLPRRPYSMSGRRPVDQSQDG